MFIVPAPVDAETIARVLLFTPVRPETWSLGSRRSTRGGTWLVRPSTPAIVITTCGQLARPYGVRRRLWRGRYRPARTWVASAAWCSRQIDAICASKPSIGRPARSRPDTIVA